MDVPRTGSRKSRRLIVAALVGGGLVACLVWLLFQVGPEIPMVERDAVVIATVKRGPMERAVRGTGTLIPDKLRYISAVTAGRIEEVLVLPGTAVTADTMILKLSNPDVELEALTAEQRVSEAQAALIEMRRTLQSELLAQEAAVAKLRMEYLDAQRQAEIDTDLGNREVVPRTQTLRSAERASALSVQIAKEEQRLSLLRNTSQEQLTVLRDQVERLRAILEHHQRRVASMQVRAGAEGVLQDLELQPGQWVQSGTTLARVVQPGGLKAQLRVGQLQAREVEPGQQALIDMRTATIRGAVKRVDPNVQDGFVRVEVELLDEPPQGARADLSVEGSIVIEQLDNVLYVDRPAYGQSNSEITLFRLVDEGKFAERVPVRLGRVSVSEVELVAGLEEGARVIISDMSRWNDAARIRLN